MRYSVRKVYQGNIAVKQEWRTISSPSPSLLTTLFRYRWGVPILAELQRREGCRFVELANRLGMSRESLTQTLAWLQDEGLAMRNPGYGHPLRPEYILAPRGELLGPSLVKIDDGFRQVSLAPLAERRWAPAVVWQVGSAVNRFSELRDSIEGVSPRALTQVLKYLLSADIVKREVEPTFPPSPIYSPTPTAKQAIILLRPLAFSGAGS